MYDKLSKRAAEFIDHDEIERTMAYARENRHESALIGAILDKAEAAGGLTHREAALLLECADEALNERIYALARRIKATGTVERIAALQGEGQLDEAMAQELVQGLHFLMGLRLQAGLHEWALHRPISGNVDPSTLSSLERDLLKDTLAVVKRFKAVLHQRLRLDLV